MSEMVLTRNGERVDRRDITQVDIEVQPLRVEVVRFAVAVFVHLAHDGDGELVVINIVIGVHFDDARG